MAFLATITAGLAAGWLPISTYVVVLAVLVVGMGFGYEQPWALRLGDRMTQREERRRNHPRPPWQTVLIVAALVVLVALVMSLSAPTRPENADSTVR